MQAALQRDTAPQIAHPDTALPGCLATASPRSLSDKLHGPHALFPLEWFPTLGDTSTWLSSLLRLSLLTFSLHCIIPVLLAFANKVLHGFAEGRSNIRKKIRSSVQLSNSKFKARPRGEPARWASVDFLRCSTTTSELD